MEHFNPLLLHNDSPAKFITIGEVMLRLTPPNYEKIRMASNFEASYGGSEANIALALANLGVDSTFFSVVPNNSLGKSAVRWLRSNDVHCTPMILSTPEETPTHRLGTYYLETGYGIRPSKVTYDRKHSAFTEYDLSKVDLDALLDGWDADTREVRDFDDLPTAARRYVRRIEHLADLARIKGQENAAAEVPRIRRQLDGLRGDARINGIQFCPRPRLTENGDVTGGTLTRFGAVPIGQHPRPFQRRENGGAVRFRHRGFQQWQPPARWAAAPGHASGER